MTLLRTFLIVCIVSCTYADAENNQPNPLSIKVGGINVDAVQVAQLVTTTAQAVSEMTKRKIDTLNGDLKLLEAQQQLLGRSYDKGSVGKAEYEQRSKTLDQQIQRINQEISQIQERNNVVGNNVQNMISSGWEAALDSYKQEGRRKTEIAVAGANKALENEGALERLNFMTQKETLIRTGAFITLTTFGAYGVVQLVKLLARYLNARFDNPELFLESSRKGLKDRLWNALWGQDTDLSTFDDILLPDELQTQLLALAQETKATHASGLPFRHLMLYGKPGTGKTMFAKKLSQYTNLPYAIIAGPSFAQFEAGKDIIKLNEIFDYAEHSDGLIVFIDEADAFLGKRENLNDRDKKLVNAFLARTGEETSKKIMFIIATNNPDLDRAVLSRIHKILEVPLPDAKLRAGMIDLYLKKHFRNALAEDVTPEFIQKLAEQTEGLSGRDINNMISDIRYTQHANPSRKITQTVLSKAGDDFRLQKEKLEAFKAYMSKAKPNNMAHFNTIDK
jgi:ATP-dependent 26S proteasome regulatory subunit